MSIWSVIMSLSFFLSSGVCLHPERLAELAVARGANRPRPSNHSSQSWARNTNISYWCEKKNQETNKKKIRNKSKLTWGWGWDRKNWQKKEHKFWHCNKYQMAIGYRESGITGTVWASRTFFSKGRNLDINLWHIGRNLGGYILCALETILTRTQLESSQASSKRKPNKHSMLVRYL